MPRVVLYNGEPLATGIFKLPVNGPVWVDTLNLTGDGQADLRVHGGVDKAVYCYSSEHYEYWRNELPGLDLPTGVFGENLTTSGLTEDDLRRGDHLVIGSAEFTVTIPRFPCFKLGIRFDQLFDEQSSSLRGVEMIKKFMKSRRPGFYLSVAKTGEIQPNDKISLHPIGKGPTIAEVFIERVARST
jgi:MOSC domain-containing protein YiiM